jgi:hypothetical protein
MAWRAQHARGSGFAGPQVAIHGDVVTIWSPDMARRRCSAPIAAICVALRRPAHRSWLAASEPVTACIAWSAVDRFAINQNSASFMAYPSTTTQPSRAAFTRKFRSGTALIMTSTRRLPTTGLGRRSKCVQRHGDFFHRRACFSPLAWFG